MARIIDGDPDLPNPIRVEHRDDGLYDIGTVDSPTGDHPPSFNIKHHRVNAEVVMAYMGNALHNEKYMRHKAEAEVRNLKAQLEAISDVSEILKDAAVVDFKIGSSTCIGTNISQEQ
jgi:hypothetical protein